MAARFKQTLSIRHAREFIMQHDLPFHALIESNGVKMGMVVKQPGIVDKFLATGDWLVQDVITKKYTVVSDNIFNLVYERMDTEDTTTIDDTRQLNLFDNDKK